MSMPQIILISETTKFYSQTCPSLLRFWFYFSKPRWWQWKCWGSRTKHQKPMDDVHLLYCSVLILVELHAADFWGVLNKQRLFVETKKKHHCHTIRLRHERKLSDHDCSISLFLQSKNPCTPYTNWPNGRLVPPVLLQNTKTEKCATSSNGTMRQQWWRNFWHVQRAQGQQWWV